MTSINGNSSSSNFNASSAKENVTNPNTPETSPKKTPVTGKRSRLSASIDSHTSEPNFADEAVKKIRTNKKTQSEITTTSKTSSDDEERPPSLEQLKEKGRKNPIKNEAIQLQAQLFETERKAKTWLASQDEIETRNERLRNEAIARGKDPEKLKTLSLNKLFELRHPYDTSLIAFYKEDKNGENNSKILEKFIWDLAVIFNVHDLFAPTKLATVQGRSTAITKGEPWGKQVEAVYPAQNLVTKQNFIIQENVWFKRGIWRYNPRASGIDLMTTVHNYNSRRGSLQIAQKGRSLRWYLQSKEPNLPSIDRRSLLRATVAAYLFGMYDAHLVNIIIDVNGQLKFFDNTRSFPNSNEFINWDRRIVSSFKCSLLAIDESLVEMSQAERVMLKKELAQYKKHFGEFMAFMESYQTRSTLAKLPPGWIEPIQALDAFEKRIQNLEKALSDPEIKTSIDLIFACSSANKFLTALSFIEIASLKNGFLALGSSPDLIKQHKKKALKWANKYAVEELIAATKYRIPLSQLFTYCHPDSKLSLDNILSWITQQLEKNKGMSLQNNQQLQEIYEDQAEEVLFKIKNDAALDNKDLSAKGSCFNYAFDILNGIELTNPTDIDPLPDLILEELTPFPQGERYIWMNTKKGEFTLFFLDKNKTLVGYTLDVQTSPGFIVIADQTYSYEEFLDDSFIDNFLYTLKNLNKKQL